MVRTTPTKARARPDFVRYDTKPEAPATQHLALQTAFDFFNARLFAGKLPACMVTMQRGRSYHGYHLTNGFSRRGGEEIVDEIAMNPETMDRDERAVLSTLVHEMVHHRQQHEGKPSRNGYHNRQWSEWMEDVGLVPSSTGAPGGKRTGQRMTHYIQDGGEFDLAYQELARSGWRLDWLALRNGKTGRSDTSKVKYSCPSCELNAWAKPDAALVCGHCREDMTPAE